MKKYRNNRKKLLIFPAILLVMLASLILLKNNVAHADQFDFVIKSNMPNATWKIMTCDNLNPPSGCNSSPYAMLLFKKSSELPAPVNEGGTYVWRFSVITSTLIYQIDWNSIYELKWDELPSASFVKSPPDEWLYPNASMAFPTGNYSNAGQPSVAELNQYNINVDSANKTITIGPNQTISYKLRYDDCLTYGHDVYGFNQDCRIASRLTGPHNYYIARADNNGHEYFRYYFASNQDIEQWSVYVNGVRYFYSDIEARTLNAGRDTAFEVKSIKDLSISNSNFSPGAIMAAKGKISLINSKIDITGAQMGYGSNSTFYDRSISAVGELYIDGLSSADGVPFGGGKRGLINNTPGYAILNHQIMDGAANGQRYSTGLAWSQSSGGGGGGGYGGGGCGGNKWDPPPYNCGPLTTGGGLNYDKFYQYTLPYCSWNCTYLDVSRYQAGNGGYARTRSIDGTNPLGDDTGHECFESFLGGGGATDFTIWAEKGLSIKNMSVIADGGNGQYCEGYTETGGGGGGLISIGTRGNLTIGSGVHLEARGGDGAMGEGGCGAGGIVNFTSANNSSIYNGSADVSHGSGGACNALSNGLIVHSLPSNLPPTNLNVEISDLSAAKPSLRFYAEDPEGQNISYQYSIDLNNPINNGGGSSSGQFSPYVNNYSTAITGPFSVLLTATDSVGASTEKRFNFDPFNGQLEFVLKSTAQTGVDANGYYPKYIFIDYEINGDTSNTYTAQLSGSSSVIPQVGDKVTLTNRASGEYNIKSTRVLMGKQGSYSVFQSSLYAIYSPNTKQRVEQNKTTTYDIFVVTSDVKVNINIVNPPTGGGYNYSYNSYYHGPYYTNVSYTGPYSGTWGVFPYAVANSSYAVTSTCAPVACSSASTQDIGPGTTLTFTITYTALPPPVTININMVNAPSGSSYYANWNSAYATSGNVNNPSVSYTGPYSGTWQVYPYAPSGYSATVAVSCLPTACSNSNPQYIGSGGTLTFTITYTIISATIKINMVNAPVGSNYYANWNGSPAVYKGYDTPNVSFTGPYSGTWQVYPSYTPYGYTAAVAVSCLPTVCSNSNPQYIGLGGTLTFTITYIANPGIVRVNSNIANTAVVVNPGNVSATVVTAGSPVTAIASAPAGVSYTATCPDKTASGYNVAQPVAQTMPAGGTVIFNCTYALIPTSSGLHFIPSVIRGGASVSGIAVFPDPKIDQSAANYEICTTKYDPANPNIPNTCSNPVRIGDVVDITAYMVLAGTGGDAFSGGSYTSTCQLINTDGSKSDCAGASGTAGVGLSRKFTFNLVQSGRMEITINGNDGRGHTFTKTVVIRVPAIKSLQ